MQHEDVNTLDEMYKYGMIKRPSHDECGERRLIEVLDVNGEFTPRPLRAQATAETMRFHPANAIPSHFIGMHFRLFGPVCAAPGNNHSMRPGRARFLRERTPGQTWLRTLPQIVAYPPEVLNEAMEFTGSRTPPPRRVAPRLSSP